MLTFVTSVQRNRLLLHNSSRFCCYSTVANNKFRILFFGQDSFATTQLKTLINEKDNSSNSRIEAIDVVYPPDLKINNSQVIQKKSDDLKSLIESKHLKVLHTPPNVDSLDKWDVPNDYDLGISVYSFEYIPLPTSLTQRFKHGALNVHPSLLPAYRGPSPIEHTIMRGDHETGVTIENDRHDILAQRSFSLKSRPVYSELEQQLADLGSQLLLDTLRQFPSTKKITSTTSNPSEAPLVQKEWSEMDFPNMSAWQAEQLSRAFKYPLTTVYGTQSKEHKDVVVKLLGLYLPKDSDKQSGVGGSAPGAFAYDEQTQALHIVFGDDSVIACNKLELDGGKVMSAQEFAKEYHKEGKFGTSLGIDDQIIENNMERRRDMTPFDK